jgi:hypothetical protein
MTDSIDSFLLRKEVYAEALKHSGGDVDVCDNRVMPAIEAVLRMFCEWQPIESAPKDKQVLLAGRDMYGSDDPGGAQWRMATGHWDEDFRPGGCWIGLGSHFPPTHWKPLDPPRES